ncbi:MAG TPA: hypothetical protein VJU78_01900 [Chitinophagaceae bacterium]|nr:hypothetical protein [Chitinophagaceae bacterium]
MRPQVKLKQKPVEPVSRFIEPYKSNIVYSKKEKHFIELKRFIFRHKLIFFGMMISFLLLFGYLHNLSTTYKSEVTISFSGYEIPEYSEEGNAVVPDFASMKEGINRMYNIVYSKEMYDHLIKKFDLYNHFGLDPQNPSSYAVLRKIIKSSITLFQGATRAITIQVTDKNSGVMSANIANEIVHKANEINKRYITEKIENRIQVYTRLHDEIKSKTNSDIADINKGIDRLTDVLGRYQASSPGVEKLLISLDDISKKIEDDVNQFLRMSNISNWTLSAMQDDVMSNVIILQDALPGDRDDSLPKWLLVIFGVVASFFITLFLFNLFNSYRHYLVLLKA